MNKSIAAELAKNANNEQIDKMFRTAAEEIKDWAMPSRANASIDRGAACNMLYKAFKSRAKKEGEIQSRLAKRNFIWCFGEFFPGYEKPVKPKKQKQEVRMSQKPDFTLLENNH